MRTRFTSIIWLVTLLALPSTALASPVYIGNSPLVPPPDGAYVSPQQVHAEYLAAGVDVVLQDIVHIGFTGIIRTPSGSDTIEHFNSTVFGNVSTNGVSGPFNPISLTGPVTVTLFGYTTGQLGTFNTEMTQLDLSGPGVLLQESPTKASTGQTKIEDIGGGLFRITSFFDVFTELSLDGGATWVESVDSTHVDLTNATPLPAALPLFATGLGALGLLGWRRKRKQAAANV